MNTFWIVVGIVVFLVVLAVAAMIGFAVFLHRSRTPVTDIEPAGGFPPGLFQQQNQVCTPTPASCLFSATAHRALIHCVSCAQQQGQAPAGKLRAD